MSEIDPVMFGRLIQSVENLTTQLSDASKDIAKLQNELANIDKRFSLGRGVVIGALLAAGGIGAGLSKIIESLFK